MIKSMSLCPACLRPQKLKADGLEKLIQLRMRKDIV